VSRFKKKKLTIGVVLKILNNPFYYGLMKMGGETYQGKHEPLISKGLFDKVQEILAIKSKNHTNRKHCFSFLNLATCPCGCAITGERQKGHNYYRCTRKKGPCHEPYTREEFLNEQISKAIQDVALPTEGYQAMLALLAEDESNSSQMLQQEMAIVQKGLHETEAMLEKLLDLHLEGLISTQEYSRKKEAFLQKKIVLEEQKHKIESNRNIWLEPMREFFKAAHQAGQMARTENLAAKRDFFRGVGSNIRLSDRTLSFSYVFPWPLLKNSRPMTTWCEGGELNPYDIAITRS
jgi:hypothetical protein